MRLAAAFGARTLDATLHSFVFELTGTTDEIDRFVKLMASVGLVEVSRTGVAAMGRAVRRRCSVATRRAGVPVRPAWPYFRSKR